MREIAGNSPQNESLREAMMVQRCNRTVSELTWVEGQEVKERDFPGVRKSAISAHLKSTRPRGLVLRAKRNYSAQTHMQEPTADHVEAELIKIHTHIKQFLERKSGQKVRADKWDYEKGTGGGLTCIIEGDSASLLEKAGVNFSSISGTDLPAAAATQFKIPPGSKYRAMGVSLVFHASSPHIPTIHANIRFFEAGEAWWFGGGIDLTPNYPRFDQIVRFHQHLRKVCSDNNQSYTDFKKQCDEYFFLKHRDEMRGVGGIFFDHLRSPISLGMALTELYEPFIDANRNTPVTPAQRDWQLYRRGRYVEFNLLYDRGTAFGLQSKGRTESILMSLPAVAHWRYCYSPPAGSAEEKVLQFYLQPQDWANMQLGSASLYGIDEKTAARSVDVSAQTDTPAGSSSSRTIATVAGIVVGAVLLGVVVYYARGRFLYPPAPPPAVPSTPITLPPKPAV